MVNNIRVRYKYLLSKFICINSFCKNCGQDIIDFTVDDYIWLQIKPYIKTGDSLCYNCFCKCCEKAGLPKNWRLIKL